MTEKKNIYVWSNRLTFSRYNNSILGFEPFLTLQSLNEIRSIL